MTSTIGPAVVVGPHDPPRGREQRPRPRRRRAQWLAAAAVFVLALAAVVVVASTRSSGPSYQPVAFAIPSAYTVQYAVTTAGSAPSTEVLSVRRPFADVDVTYPGTHATGTPNLTVVHGLGTQVLKASTAEASQMHVPAAAAPLDIRADVVVPAGLRVHALKFIGSRTVLGRRCQVFRSSRPLGAGPLLPLTSHSSYTDTCIDASGIVLRETRFGAGRRLMDRLANEVSTGDAAVAGAPFDLTGSATPFDHGGGAFRALTLDSRPPGRSWDFARPPVGFTHVGRYAAIPPQPQLFAGGGEGTGAMGLPGGLVTEMDDVYVRGADSVVLQQGSTINGAKFTPPSGSIPVQLGALGAGQLLLAGNVTTVVAEPGNGEGFVRLSATLPADAVIALMRSLAPQPGGTLTRLPGAGS